MNEDKLPPTKVKAERDLRNKGYQPLTGGAHYDGIKAPNGGLHGAASGETERPPLAERMAKDKQRVATSKRRAAGGV